jgi:hypothetical protein
VEEKTLKVKKNEKIPRNFKVEEKTLKMFCKND